MTPRSRVNRWRSQPAGRSLGAREVLQHGRLGSRSASAASGREHDGLNPATGYSLTWGNTPFTDPFPSSGLGIFSSRVTKPHHDSWTLSDTGAAMPDELEPWVTSEEICEYLSISANTLTRWIAVRGMPANRVGRSLRFKVSEVDAWVRSTPAADDKSVDRT